jgi:hypothetical protein
MAEVLIFDSVYTEKEITTSAKVHVVPVSQSVKQLLENKTVFLKEDRMKMQKEIKTDGFWTEQSYNIITSPKAWISSCFKEKKKSPASKDSSSLICSKATNQ